ncbi:histone methylation DOT1, partial [Hanseniaspora valbyensis NRRL Y-1626]
KLPLYFMKHITNYIYGRIILPDAKKLTKYEGFSDKTYGELMSDFLTLAFDKCGMNSESTFVDLGSGIGNTNFFASLSYNVKSSFGCEIMKNPSELCGLYHNYFIKMLQLYGISNHTVLEFELEKSFMDNEVVNEKLKSCSILLLNNFIFSPSINIEATKLVKYLPSGSKIIHLKPLQTLEKQ